ncbi:hypothetical protein V4U86_28210 [Mycobacterium sp. AMU20-3851]|jgi:hypothetical protein|uniref:hypothetical protein n=1 Tax=Mycobacterium sp. AMU20-3851 TaxID=3122055 RepID=UPI003754AF9C
MNIITRRVATGIIALAAPAIIAVGAATTSQASTAAVNPGPSTSQVVDAKYNQAAKAGATTVRHRHHGYYHRR